MRSPAIVGLGLCLAGCAFFVNPSQSSAERAREIYPKCKGASEEALLPLFSADAVDSVAPAYMYRPGSERRIKGARIVARPAPGWSPELLARDLECHEARVALGLLPARPDEPYAIPARWVSVDVESDGTAFAIVLHTPDLDDAQEVAARAQRFYAHR